LVSVALVTAAFVVQLPDQRAVRSVESRLDDLAGAARVVQRNAQPGDGVVFLPSRYRAAALAYPNAFTGVHDLALAQTPIEAANLRGRDRSRAATRTTMLAAERIWVIGRPGLRIGSNEGGATNEREVLRQNFTQVSRARVHGLEIALYIRKPASSGKR